jgi:hypothetical protein
MMDGPCSICWFPVVDPRVGLRWVLSVASVRPASCRQPSPPQSWIFRELATRGRWEMTMMLALCWLVVPLKSNQSIHPAACPDQIRLLYQRKEQPRTLVEKGEHPSLEAFCARSDFKSDDRRLSNGHSEAVIDIVVFLARLRSSDHQDQRRLAPSKIVAPEEDAEPRVVSPSEDLIPFRSVRQICCVSPPSSLSPLFCGSSLVVVSFSCSHCVAS